MSPAGLLPLALLIPAAPPAAGPRLQRGDELTYTGTVTESVDRPGNRFRRAHDLEARVFVLDRQAAYADAAVLTLLRRAPDPAVAGGVPAVTGTTPEPTGPPAARLDLVRLYEDGTVHLLAPSGQLPLRLAPDTPARAAPAVPLDAFAPLELGMFPPRPRDGARPWSLASTDPARPAEAWQVGPFDFVNAERCAQLAMAQQTPDWDAPRGGQTAWQRTDTVWVSTQDGTARRVHRVIRQRDGLAAAPAVLIEVRYALKDQAGINGRTYARYRNEIEVAYAAGADLPRLLPDAARLGPEPFRVRLAKLDAHLEATDPGTPYREAVLAVRRQLDAARRGEVAPVTAPVVPPPAVPPAAPGAARPPAVGQPAPDFRAGGFRLGEARGKPVVLVFFMPGQVTTDLSLAVADALQKRYGDRTAVVPLAVFADPAEGIKDRDRLRLTVPVYDGAAAVTPYAVDTFPRFLLVDAAGAVRWAFAGVGAETGFLLREQVDRLLASPPAGTVTPSGTGYPAAPGTPLPAPRP